MKYPKNSAQSGAVAANGAAILVISQDLDELMELCDRLAVLHEGTLSVARPIQDWTIQSLGLAMTGAEPTLPPSDDPASDDPAVGLRAAP